MYNMVATNHMQLWHVKMQLVQMAKCKIDTKFQGPAYTQKNKYLINSFIIIIHWNNIL